MVGEQRDKKKETFKMKRWIHASEETNELNLANNALFAKEGDQIYDKVKDRIGEVVKTSQSGTYGLIYVDFNDGSNIMRINPMDVAQGKGRFFKINASTSTESRGYAAAKKFKEKYPKAYKVLGE